MGSFWIGLSIGMVVGAALMIALCIVAMRSIGREIKTRRENVETDVMIREALKHGRKFSLTVHSKEQGE